MRILVLQQPAPDLRIAPERDLRTGARCPEWDVVQLDPADSAALELGLRLRDATPESEVVVLHAGPAEVEPWLREGLARGADRAVRVWDGVVAEANPPGLAAVVAAAAGALSCDLVLAGAAGAAFGSGQLGVLVARALGWVCVTQIAGLADPDPTEEGTIAAPAVMGPLRLRRALAAGWVGLVEVETPAVLTVVPSPASQQAEFDAPLPAALAALKAEIAVWDLARLGVSTAEVRSADHALRYGDLRTPRPRLQPVTAPDPALSAFERIQGLVRGVVRRREGRVVRAGELSVAQEVFAALRDEGWLDHLRADRSAPESDPGMPFRTSGGAQAADAGDAPGPVTAFAGETPTHES